MNSHRPHSRTSANHFAKVSSWLLAKPLSPPQSNPSSLRGQGPRCRGTLTRSFSSVGFFSSPHFPEKRLLEFLVSGIPWDSTCVRSYFPCSAFHSPSEFHLKYYGPERDWGNFKSFRAQNRLVTWYFSPPLLTNHNVVVPYLESEDLQEHLVGPQGE